MRIAMIGTRGVPARYGGFETAVEHIGTHLVQMGHDVTVYCRNPGQRLTSYRGMRLVNLPALRHRTAETLSHSALSTVHAIMAARPDVGFVFNAANAPVIPALRAAGIPVAINVDGLESRRSKWRGANGRGLGASYFTWAEAAACRWANAVIADSRAIQAHIEHTHGVSAHFIPYGIPESPATDSAPLTSRGLTPGGYWLVVARLEPENQVDVIIDAYRSAHSDIPLVVVGGTTYSHSYADKVHALAAADHRVRILGSIYDSELLDALYTHAHAYVHGHSVGGTNPSLLHALGRNTPVFAFDCVFNQEVLDHHGHTWRDQPSLQKLFTRHMIDSPEEAASSPAWNANDRYSWHRIAAQYERLGESLSDPGNKMVNASHHRRTTANVANAQEHSELGGE